MGAKVAKITVYGAGGKVLVVKEMPLTCKRVSQQKAAVEKKAIAIANEYRNEATYLDVEGFFDSRFSVKPETVRLTYKGKVVEVRETVALEWFGFVRDVKRAEVMLGMNREGK